MYTVHSSARWSLFLVRLPFLASNYRHCPNKLLFSLLPLGPASNPGPKWAQSNYCTAAATATSGRRYHNQRCQKIVVIMGPTGCGKSRLSIDFATRFFPSEIINSDKIQVYRGLDIITNKIPMRDRRGVPHHLLGAVDPSLQPFFTPSDFRSAAASVVEAIASRHKLPLVVGGSNSFIHALVTTRFNPDSDVFRVSDPDLVGTELRYDCCFLWVDVALPVLNQYLMRRIDDMVEAGMFHELAEYFQSENFCVSDPATRTGLMEAIGVPEFEPYFRRFAGSGSDNGPLRRQAYEEAVRKLKENTCELAERQVGKILLLRSAGWKLWRLDATEAFRAAMGTCRSDPGRSSEIWERQVVEPGVKIVKSFWE
ncbi:Adenylate dimethylallyltransferase [Bertholletia excelsa]